MPDRCAPPPRPTSAPGLHPPQCVPAPRQRARRPSRIRSALSVESRFGVRNRRRLARPFHQSSFWRGAQAKAMISRASASTLRPDAAARWRKSAWTSSGSLRIVSTDAMTISPASACNACVAYLVVPAAAVNRLTPRGGVVHPPRPDPPVAPPARCRRDPSQRWPGRGRGRNRNTARPARWPSRPATATVRSPGRCP